jgi:acetylornithine deacetylase
MSDSPPSSLDWTTRLVELDTTSRDTNLPLIEVVEAELKWLGIDSTRLPNADGSKANLVATLPGHDGGTSGGVVLSSHTDVVPVDGQEWSSQPFTPEVRDGRLYGRGTADMKSFIGVVLALLPRYAAARLSEPVHLALSYDEEVGCLGAVDIAEHFRARAEQEGGPLPRACIVGEPTSMRVIPAHKSINLIDLVFHGKAAHSSLTPQGVNAVEYAARAITFIRGIADQRRAEGPFDEAYVVPHTTASVNVVQGGIAGNTVAERCHVQFEFRTVGADDPQEVLDRIEEHVRGLEREMQAEDPSARVEMTPVALVPGLDTAADSPAIAFATGLGGIPSTDKVTYGTEAGLFDAVGIPTVVCGPGDIAQAHSPDEFVELAQVEACEQFLTRLLEQLTTQDPTTEETR